MIAYTTSMVEMYDCGLFVRVRLELELVMIVNDPLTLKLEIKLFSTSFRVFAFVGVVASRGASYQ